MYCNLFNSCTILIIKCNYNVLMRVPNTYVYYLKNSFVCIINTHVYKCNLIHKLEKRF